jgi:hypothetical protein
VIRVVCSDPTVSAVRARITYRDSDNEEQHAVMLSDLIVGPDGNGLGGFVTLIPQANITAVELSELREGAKY